MGSPLSPVLANIYMEMFKEEAIDSATYKPSLWVRYVDDTFVIWPYDRDKLQDFLGHLNNRQESIKFTMEEENAGSIPFLDVLVKRSGNQLTTSVYRKRTHTNRYLHFGSYHHPRVKVGIISCLRDRAERICNEKNIKEEKNHLQVFEANGYPPGLVQHSRKGESWKAQSNKMVRKMKTTQCCVCPMSKDSVKRLRSRPKTSTSEQSSRQGTRSEAVS